MSLHTGLDQVRAPEPPDFSFGHVLTVSLWILVWNLTRFLTMAVLIAIPLAAAIAVVHYLLPREGFQIDFSHIEIQPSDLPATLVALLLVILTVATYLVTQGAIAYRTVQSLAGRSASNEAAITRSVATLPRMLGAGITLAIVYGSLGVTALFAGGVLPPVASDSTIASPTRASIVLALALIAFLYLGIIWWVLIPALVMERAGALACFARSWYLTEGRRGTILAILLLFCLVEASAQVLLGRLDLPPLSLPAMQLLWLQTAPVLVPVQQILSGLVGFVFFCWGSVLAAIGYYHLLGEKEGAAALVKAFD